MTNVEKILSCDAQILKYIRYFAVNHLNAINHETIVNNFYNVLSQVHDGVCASHRLDNGDTF